MGSGDETKVQDQDESRITSHLHHLPPATSRYQRTSRRRPWVGQTHVHSDIYGGRGFHVRFLKFTGVIFDCDCNVQLSTAIQLFIISASTTQSLISALNCDSVFQRSAAIPTFNRDSVFQRSAAIATFNRDSVFQRSAAIPTFNRDSVFQRSAAIPTFNRDSVFQRSTAIATFNCDCNSQPRFNFSTRFQLSTAI